MLGMLYKEFRLNILSLLIIMGLSLVYMVLFTFMLSENGLLHDIYIDDISTLIFIIPEMTTLFLACAMAGSSFGGDERKKWAYFTTSLPCDYKTAIGAKYLYNLFALLSIKLLIELFYCIARDAGLFDNKGISLLIYFISFMLFIQSIEFPNIVRFGSTVSSYFRIGLFLAAAIAVTVWYLYFMPRDFDLSTVWDKLFKLMEGGEGAINISNALNILCLSVIPIYYISYKLSCRLYLKGVETHYAK